MPLEGRVPGTPNSSAQWLLLYGRTLRDPPHKLVCSWAICNEEYDLNVSFRTVSQRIADGAAPANLIAAGNITGLEGNQIGRQASSLVDDACGGARNRFTNPIATVDDRGWLVGLAGGETLVFAAAGPPQDGTEQFAGDYRHQAEFPLHLFAQCADLGGNLGVRPGETVFHGPDETDPGVAQGAALALPALADAAIRVVLVAQVAGAGGAADAKEAGAVAFEIALECPIQQTGGLLARDGGVLEVESVLAVDIGQVHVEQAPLPGHLGIERRTGDRGVEHELVQIGLVGEGMLDLFVNVLRRMVFQADDSGAEQHDAVLAQFAGELQGIGAIQLGVVGARGFQAQPDGGDADLGQFLIGVLGDGVGGRENVECPALDRKSTRLNSSHRCISYAVFCLKKKK